MRVRPAVSVAVAAIATAGVLAGCSSSSKTSSPPSSGSSAGSSSTAPALSGTPITVEIITQLSGGAGAELQPELVNGANAAASAVNASGGIQGHPLKVTVCDTQTATDP